MNSSKPMRGAALSALCVMGAVMLLASDASAERILLLGFEGSNGRALRWRVAGALKRSGHSVVGVAPPKSPTPEKLRAFAKRRKVDLFISGESSRVDDGWELVLNMRDAEGEELGKGLTISAPSYRAIIKELRQDAQGQIDDAVRGGGSARAPAKGPRRVVEPDAPGEDEPPPPEADFAGNARALAQKKKAARPAPAAIDLDADSNAEPEASEDEEASAPPRATSPAASDEGESDEEEASAPADTAERRARATSWSSSDSTPKEDDGRDSFLAGGDGNDGESADVGVDDESSKDESKGASDPTVILGLNAGFVRRTLQYSDNLYGRLRAPSANSWVYRLQAAVYPFAKPVKNRLGLIAGYESEFSGVVRDNAAGTDFGVTFSEVYGGVKLRQPLGKHELGLEGTVGSMKAGLDDPTGVARVPEFSYTSLRAALDVGFHFSSLSLSGALGYRLPIGGYGEASEADWFPRMEGYGLEGNVGIEYRISKEVAFDVSGNMRRYLLQMNSRPQDALDGTSEVAGGAVDLYLGGYFGLNITL